MRIRLPESGRPDTERGVLPLINIVFLLLIFFLLAGTVSRPLEVRLDLPFSRQSDPARPNPSGIYISGDDRIFFKGENLDLENLPAALGNAEPTETGKDGKSMAVFADRGSRVETVAAVIGAAEDAGFDSIKLLTSRLNAK